MKISDLLNESQTQQLDELTAADVGRGIGKVAKGVGAVAGGIAGIPGAVKKGFQAGKQTVSGAADSKPAAAPAAKPAVQPAAQQEPADEPAAASAAPAAKAEPAQDNSADVAAIKKELDSFLQTYKQDLEMQNKNWNFVVPKVNALEKQMANLTKSQTPEPEAAADEKPGFLKSATDKIKDRAKQTQTQSIQRTGRAVNESIQLFRK